MKYFLLFVICYSFIPLQAQEEVVGVQVIDSLYREDQFYVGVSFNLLGDKPAGISQSGFSGGLQTGFIRDMPFNIKRTKSIGVGIGVAADTFNQNLFIGEGENINTIAYDVITSDVNEDVNRFTYYSLEVPIEYRWRTSTPTDYSFWRIHAGVRFGYIFGFKSTFENDGTTVEIRDIPEVNTFQYGLTLSFGYGTFNLQAYYGLSTLFDENAVIRGETVDLQVLRLGLQFSFL